MPPSQYFYCTRTMTMLYMSGLCSTLFILSMTFERFYSIIKPHKAASFNTVKRAKITVICIVIFSIIFNIPHWFISGNIKAASFNSVKRAKITIFCIAIFSILVNVPHLYITANNGKSCVPFSKSMQTLHGQLYYWFSVVFNFVIPLTLLLFLNSVIIHTLRKRSMSGVVRSGNKGEGENGNQVTKMKSSEKQMFVLLLLVNFAFLIFTIPPYSLSLYVNFVDYRKSPSVLVRKPLTPTTA